jgi:Cation transporting ATPase, C-terminus
MDTLGALALATQTPSIKLLDRQPYSATTPLISKKMWRHILIQGIAQFIILLVVFEYAYTWFNISIDNLAANGYYLSDNGVQVSDCEAYRSTLLFNIFTFCTIWNEFNSRSLDDRWDVLTGIHKDKAFIGVIIASAFMQAILIEFGGTFVNTTGLTAKDWGITIGISLIVLPLGILQRLVPIANSDSDFASYYGQAFNQRMAILAQQQQQSQVAAKTGFLPAGIMMGAGAGAGFEAVTVAKPTLAVMGSNGEVITHNPVGAVIGTGGGTTPPSTAMTVISAGGIEVVSPSPAPEPTGFSG